MVGRRADRHLLPYPAGGRVQPVQRAVLPDGPDQARGHDGRPAARPGTPQQVQRGRRTGGLDRDDAGQARQVDRHALHSDTAVDVVAAGRSQGGLLVADAAQVRAVEQVDDPGLPGQHHLAVGQQRRRDRHVQVLGVVRGPRARREELHQLQGRRQLQDRIAVVVGVLVRVDRSVPGADPDVAVAVDDRCRAAHPDGSLALPGRGVDGEVPRRPARFRNCRHPALVAGAVPVVTAEAEHDLAGVQGQPGALQQRRGIGPRRVHVLGHLDPARGSAEADQPVRRASRRLARRPPRRSPRGPGRSPGCR